MLFRLKVATDSVDSKGKTFQAAGDLDLPREEMEQIAADLESGAPVRFYRGGQPHGRVTTARASEDGLWLRVRITARDADIWKLVETGAVNTVEVQPLTNGADVFLKSVAATYPAGMV